MHPHERKNNHDPIAQLVQRAKLGPVPETNVTANVLRQIRNQNSQVAEKPLMWLALGSTAAATAIAIVSTPIFLSLIDPLNALFQSTPTSLF